MKFIKKIIFFLLILFILYPKFSIFAYALPFGTQRVLVGPLLYCLNGGVMIIPQPTYPISNPPGNYFVPVGTNRYQNFIYPPFYGVKMLGKYIPGGVCLIPAPWGTFPIPAIGTVIEYGSAFGF